MLFVNFSPLPDDEFRVFEKMSNEKIVNATEFLNRIDEEIMKFGGSEFIYDYESMLKDTDGDEKEWTDKFLDALTDIRNNFVCGDKNEKIVCIINGIPSKHALFLLKCFADDDFARKFNLNDIKIIYYFNDK